MNPMAALRVSYRALRKNQVRSMLTTLGIIIGVAAVITMVAVTQGAKKLIEEQLISLGGNSLIIGSGMRAGSGATERSAVDTLTAEDAEAIGKLSMVTHVSPILDTNEWVVWNNRNRFTTIVGASPDFTYINDWPPEQGSFFTDQDIINAERVCVLGRSVALNLFGYHNPVGETVRIGRITFKVIGVLTTIGQTPSGKDQDDVVIVPYSTLQKRIMGMAKVEKISVSVRTQDDIPYAEAQIAQLLRERHQIRPGMEDDFYIRTQQNIIDRIFTISRIMTILLGSIASISLIVGGIGIMNIMLVSVTERIREIGIRMAVGAKERDILIQFLIEAVVLSLVGGIIGILLGIIATKTASLLTGWPSLVSVGAIILAFGFAALIGVFFGLYPAKKASKLDPIEALRYE
ncbi:MAG TPA: ABC transporter permease [Thermodesulfobacteriota bacterium]|nr:ABC transporter permease [Thermodesulfobacteriota bacterium]